MEESLGPSATPTLGSRSTTGAALRRELVIEEALAAATTEGLTVERIALLGHPAKELTDAAEGADLLVVGARGLGGFRGLLLGAVTQYVLSAAVCPVAVIVPEER